MKTADTHPFCLTINFPDRMGAALVHLLTRRVDDFACLLSTFTRGYGHSGTRQPTAVARRGQMSIVSASKNGDGRAKRTWKTMVLSSQC